jgi:glycosyltransferase involved in cell wall biosynthesis
MRTLFFHLGSHWSASSRAFAVAARGLVARGESVVVVPRAGTSRLQGFSEYGLDPVAFPVTKSISGDSWRLRAILREHNIEAGFVHTEREQLVLSSAMRLAQRGVVVRRIPAGGAPTAGTFATWSSRLATTRFLFTSESDRSRSGQDRNSFVAPLGVTTTENDDFRSASRLRLAVGDDVELIVCAADSAPSSRVTTLMRAIALLAERHSALRLVLVGYTTDTDDLRMHSAALGITPLVRFIGPQIDAPAVLGAADIGWIASGGDDAAFASLDFMAAGVPVIAERTPVVTQLVPDGIAGVLLPEADPADTASVLARMLRDEGARRAMGSAGRARVRRDFTESAMIDGFASAAAASLQPAFR